MVNKINTIMKFYFYSLTVVLFFSCSSSAQIQKQNENVIVDSVAEKMLLFQRSYGGWPKHYKEKAIDYNAKYSDSELAGIKDDKNRNDATIDNKATTKEIIYLVKAFKKTSNTNYLNVATNGINYLLKAQYKNGGWPQFYPDLSSYRHQITFNDYAMTNVLNLLQDIVEKKNDMDMFDETISSKCQKAIDKGIKIILQLQIKQGKTLTAWCAQYDDISLEPDMARKFELASISGSESVGIVEYLMRQNNPSKKIIDAINAAIKWFELVKIENKDCIDIKDTTQPKGKDRVLVDKPGNTIWARFYDIETNKPFFADRTSTKQTTLAAIENERRVGYAYYGNWPLKLLKDKYPSWKLKYNIQ